MLSDDERFNAWPVFESYTVESGRVLPVGQIARRYHALREPALYVALLRTRGSDAGILEFVSKYGLSAGRDRTASHGFYEASERRHREGDALADWKLSFSQARRFQRYVGLVRKGRHFGTAGPLSPDMAAAREGIWQWATEEVSNRELQRHYRIALECEDHRWQLRLVPYGLIGLIWKQLVDMLLGNRRFESCKNCGELFEIRPRGEVGSRRNRVFCSDRCRATVGNEKKRKAHEMLKRGVPTREVASAVGISLNTVKGWEMSQKVKQ